ncbi:platelet endothelial aggregation receptor 1-like [Drosophila nasuta]|uniref:platelet endothelial aggregation receptor 1-like n=1 Tax=Drosophila nasuta TaxID=42062 RepID=UPI00295F2FA8|nr:platelet endothelial aggregation receptor 1-like [Drosophila nasuta]
MSLPRWLPSTNGDHCLPTCKNECAPYAECTSPNNCDCHPGYKKNATGDCLPICAPECEEFSYCISPGTCACKDGYQGEGNYCTPICSNECEDNSYCAQPEKCECFPGYNADDQDNRNCSSPTAMWILIFLGVVTVIALISLISFIVYVFTRYCKKPSYSNEKDIDVSDMRNYVKEVIAVDAMTFISDYDTAFCMMARRNREFLFLFLIQLYVSINKCEEDISWCLPDTVIENITKSVTVDHVQILVDGKTNRIQVKEKNQVQEAIPRYNSTTCRPKCSPTCVEHSTCKRIPHVRRPQCICDEGYSGNGCLPQCEKTTCGKNTVCNSPGNCDCLSGYVRSTDNTTNCVPVCDKPCGKFQSCVAPNVCNCTIGYEQDPLGHCHPICSKSCNITNFEVCVKPNDCQCVEGYARVENKCQPQCPQKCGLHQKCVKPEVCLCETNYKFDYLGVCQPICLEKCGKNEECIKPGNCTCKVGYWKNNKTETCEPYCSKGCPNYSTCGEPEKCKCNDGYQMSISGICEPKCDKCGNHTYCKEPEKCLCLDGYHRPTPSSDPCLPTCKNECGPYAECTSPNNCDCHPGYKKNATGDCLPICAPECEEFSYCISPGTCACKDGYQGEGNYCTPICSNECEENSYCAQPEKCECFPGYNADDQDNRNCSSPTAMWILIFLGVVTVIALISLISFIVYVFIRCCKKPSYSNEKDIIVSDMRNVDLGQVDTSPEGIDNSSYI